MIQCLARGVTFQEHATIQELIRAAPSWVCGRGRAGMRLHTVEIVNWGTFDKLI